MVERAVAGHPPRPKKMKKLWGTGDREILKKLKKLGGEGKMARKKSEAAQRRKTLESLKNALVSNKLSEKFLQDKVDEYMSFYDDLSWINETLIALKSSGNCSIKVYTDATAEKRRISSEMRNILRFLGLKPQDVNLTGGEDDEEL